jgi:hypothetical protein
MVHRVAAHFSFALFALLVDGEEPDRVGAVRKRPDHVSALGEEHHAPRAIEWNVLAGKHPACSQWRRRCGRPERSAP